MEGSISVDVEEVLDGEANEDITIDVKENVEGTLKEDKKVE